MVGTHFHLKDIRMLSHWITTVSKSCSESATHSLPSLHTAGQEQASSMAHRWSQLPCGSWIRTVREWSVFFQMRSLINNNGCYCEIIINNNTVTYYYWYKGSKFMRKYKVYFEDETETVSWTWTGLNLQRTLILLLVRILAMFILAPKVSALVACTLHVTS